MKNYKRYSNLQKYKNMSVNEFLDKILESLSKREWQYRSSATYYARNSRVGDFDGLYEHTVNSISDDLGLTPIEFEDIFRERVTMSHLRKPEYYNEFLYSDGAVDALLYKLTNGQNEIGGYKISQMDLEDSLIKYNYGYLDSQYGRIWIEQSYDEKGFLEDIANKLENANEWEQKMAESLIDNSDVIERICETPSLSIKVKNFLTAEQKEKFKDYIEANNLGLL